MIDENRNKLRSIIEHISDGSYSILGPQQWDKFSRDLALCGANMQNEINQLRNKTRETKVFFPFLKIRRTINTEINNYETLAKDFDLFYDSSMKFLRSIIENNEYQEYQILQKQYIEKLSDHCSKSIAYLGDLISSKRSEYYHFQTLNIAILAIFVAVFSLIVGLSK